MCHNFLMSDLHRRTMLYFIIRQMFVHSVSLWYSTFLDVDSTFAKTSHWHAVKR